MGMFWRIGMAALLALAATTANSGAQDAPSREVCAAELEEARAAGTPEGYDRFLDERIECFNWERALDEQLALRGSAAVAPEPPPVETAVPPQDEAAPAAAFERVESPELADLELVEEAAQLRTYAAEGFLADLEVGPLELYEDELVRRDVSTAAISYEREFDDAFVYSGEVADEPGEGFYVLALRDGGEALVLTMLFPVGPSGVADQATQDRVSAIACSTRFGAAALPCAN